MSLMVKLGMFEWSFSRVIKKRMMVVSDHEEGKSVAKDEPVKVKTYRIVILHLNPSKLDYMW